MNETPTSGPIRTSRTHHARDASSSRHSLSSSQTNGRLRERKEQLFQVRRSRRVGALGELGNGAFAAHAAAAQQHEAVAYACGVGDLMNREEQRATVGGMIAQRGAHVTRLPQIEAVERL